MPSDLASSTVHYREQAVNNISSEDIRPEENVGTWKHKLPPLMYAYSALEPCIDSNTLMRHHVLHHGGHVAKLNSALEKAPDLHKLPVLGLLRNLDHVPKEIREIVHQNACAHVNHSMFWRAMSPRSEGEPRGALREAIDHDFGSFSGFKNRFEKMASGLIESGWVWLVRTRRKGSKLEVITTSGNDHPTAQDCSPILLNDVWEHAYAPQYEKRRQDYLKAWWTVVDWEQASRCFAASSTPKENFWMAQGAHARGTYR
jgi:Fe-Mn family superoxide dismutase